MSKRLWEHQPGDSYAVLVGRGNDSPKVGCGTDWALDFLRFHGDARALPKAQSHGFKLAGSDNFNIAAFRDNHLAAVLWMQDVVVDDPEELLEIAVQTGCSVAPVDHDDEGTAVNWDVVGPKAISVLRKLRDDAEWYCSAIELPPSLYGDNLLNEVTEILKMEAP